MDKKLTYKDSGVDVDTAEAFVQTLKTIVKPTYRHEVISDIGGFSGLFGLNVDKYKHPVLVSATDGVGTKLRLAFMMNRHDTIGIDLVAMCVNDIIVQGAEPLFMLDYISTGKINNSILSELVTGIAAGCKEAGCSLIGGETAEMPSFYSEGEYDIAGFVVGVVERDNIVDGSSVSVGDRIIGIASNGIHSNGYSLVRKLFFEELKLSVDDYIEELQCVLGEELLKPTRIYAKPVLNILRDFRINAMAHITGGGLTENIARVLPKGCVADIDPKTWQVPAIFKLMQEKGNIDTQEMMRTFNNGIGMVIIVPHSDLEEIMFRLKGLKERAFVIGEIAPKQRKKKSIYFKAK